MIDLGKATVTIEYTKLVELMADRTAAVHDSGEIRMRCMELEQKNGELIRVNEELTAELRDARSGSQSTSTEKVPGDTPVL